MRHCSASYYINIEGPGYRASTLSKGGPKFRSNVAASVLTGIFEDVMADDDVTVSGPLVYKSHEIVGMIERHSHYVRLFYALFEVT